MTPSERAAWRRELVAEIRRRNLAHARRVRLERLAERRLPPVVVAIRRQLERIAEPVIQPELPL